MSYCILFQILVYHHVHILLYLMYRCFLVSHLFVVYEIVICEYQSSLEDLNGPSFLSVMTWWKRARGCSLPLMKAQRLYLVGVLTGS